METQVGEATSETKWQALESMTVDAKIAELQNLMDDPENELDGGALQAVEDHPESLDAILRNCRKVSDEKKMAIYTDAKRKLDEFYETGHI